MRASSTMLSFLVATSWAQAAKPDVADAAARHGLPPSLVRAVVDVESRGDSSAVSRRGAMGLMQLMPETASRFGVVDPFDAAQSLEGGCSYLRWLLDRFDGSLALALAAYNAGEAAVDRYAGIPPFPETRAYVRDVLSRLGSSTVAPGQPAPTSVVTLAPVGALSSIVAGGAR